MSDKHTPQEDASPHRDPADLLRYMAGELPDAEAQRLEADSLEDPFLADALEGIESTSNKIRLEQMAYSLNQDLKRRLKHKQQRHRWIGFQSPTWWPWLVLILLMLIVLSYLFIHKAYG